MPWRTYLPIGTSADACFSRRFTSYRSEEPGFCPAGLVDLEFYQRPIAVSPHRFEAHLSLGRLLQEQGQLDLGDHHYELAEQGVLGSGLSRGETESRLMFLKVRISAFKQEILGSQSSLS